MGSQSYNLSVLNYTVPRTQCHWDYKIKSLATYCGNMVKKQYIAKLIIKNLSQLSEIELDRLIGWLELRLAEVRYEYEKLDKKLALNEDPEYAKTYTSRLLN